MPDNLGGSPSLLRALNARTVLDTLADGGAMSRSTIMGSTGLSRTAVTQLLGVLAERGVVVPAGLDHTTGGPAARQVVLDPALGLAVAAHVTEDRVRVRLVDASGAIHADAEGPAGEDAAASLAALIARACGDDLPRGAVQCGVVGVAGIVDAHGRIRSNAGSDDGAFRAVLTDALGVDMRIENDVNLAAIADVEASPSAQSTAAYVSLTGALGAALVIDGRLHRGRSGGAGEVAYLPQPGIPLGSPSLDRDEIARLAAHHGVASGTPFELVIDAAASGDPAARATVDAVAGRIAVVAASLCLVLDPDVIVLAGYAGHPTVVPAVRRHLDTYADRLPVPTRVSAAGPDATLAGARSEASAALRDLLFSRIIASLTESTVQ
jgi:predicted NBD/HSP70 family sugar kinase